MNITPIYFFFATAVFSLQRLFLAILSLSLRCFEHLAILIAAIL